MLLVCFVAYMSDSDQPDRDHISATLVLPAFQAGGRKLAKSIPWTRAYTKTPRMNHCGCECFPEGVVCRASSHVAIVRYQIGYPEATRFTIWM
jgi:hypothetical protein